MSETKRPLHPIRPELKPRGSFASGDEPEWIDPGSGWAVIAVASTGAVTAVNLAAVSLVGPPAPYHLGLGLGQFIATRYHRVIDAWSVREAGDGRAAHHDPLTLCLSAMRPDGSEVRVLLTRRMLGEGPSAPFIATMRTFASSWAPMAPAGPAACATWSGASVSTS